MNMMVHGVTIVVEELLPNAVIKRIAIHIINQCRYDTIPLDDDLRSNIKMYSVDQKIYESLLVYERWITHITRYTLSTFSFSFVMLRK